MRDRGFTLIEILLSVTIIGILAGLSLPVYRTFQVKNDLSIAVDTVVQSARRAQELSRATQGDETWGVDVRSGSITVFQGANYASRNTDRDETFEIASSMNVSGVTEFVFTKLTGLPQTIGSLTLTTVAGETAIVTINSKGMIDF